MSARRRNHDGRHIEISGVAVSPAVVFAAISELGYLPSACLVTNGVRPRPGAVGKVGAVQRPARTTR
jgi:hypothetical protein